MKQQATLSLWGSIVTPTCSPVSFQMAALQKPLPQTPKAALPSVISVNKGVAIKYLGLGTLAFDGGEVGDFRKTDPSSAFPSWQEQQ